MQFQNVIGQFSAKHKLQNMMASGRMPHALLISAAEGFGGLPLAVALAQYINCENPTVQDSCGVCEACNKIKKLIHPDVFFTYPTVSQKSGDKPVSTDFIKQWRKAFSENPYLTYNQWLTQITDDNKQGNITVNECHEIIKRISLKNYEGKFKVQIIWMAELLREAGNALLKSIEEPPANTVFILVTEQPELILNTILSRTQMLCLPPIEHEAIEQAIAAKIDFERKDEAKRLANLSGGSWATALELMNEEDSEVEDIFLNWFRYSAGNFSVQTASGVLQIIDEFHGLKREKQKLFVRYGLFFIENCLLQKLNGENFLQHQALEASKKIAARYSVEAFEKVTNLLNKLHYQIERNANAKISLHSTSIKVNEAMAI
ncbi:MAG: hypothetical protein BGO32_05925 [Bacteroidetes bacterium 37-13]|nr:MAG: hypothetical protein BGO32_05925 [Bacteroidetes bacterium 37-13]